MDKTILTRQLAHPVKIFGSTIEAKLTNVSIGEICEVRCSWLDTTVIATAQVIGFNSELTILSLIGKNHGLSRESVLVPTGRFQTITVGDFLLGTVVSASGQVVDSLCDPQQEMTEHEQRAIDVEPPKYYQRKSIDQAFVTNIKAIDGLITCGLGQRIGIFAAAGSGKTSLMKMIVDFSQADIFVIGLIGERGREVTEFVDEIKKSARAKDCIIVFGTSDYSALERANAALQATTIAEHFCAKGLNVVLFIDSMTRYARALRDVSLAAGDMPVRRGYPTSVFEKLPQLLERPGNFHSGSITAFYTILLENEVETDPIAEEIRSILDGHIYLSRKLAEKHHYPAIDVLRSQSRLFSIVTSRQQQDYAANIRTVLAKIEDLEVLINFGEYKEGQNAENDRAVSLKDDLSNWLQQESNTPVLFNTTLRDLYEFTQ